MPSRFGPPAALAVAALLAAGGITARWQLAPGLADAGTPGSAASLHVRLATGADDLRAASTVWLLLEHRTPNRELRIREFILNRQGPAPTGRPIGFPPRSIRVARLEWGTPVPLADIRRVGVRFVQGGSGITGDTWDLDGISVDLLVPAREPERLLEEAGTPLNRFTGTPRINDWWSGVLAGYRP